MGYKFTQLNDGSGRNVGALLSFDSVTILIDPAWSGENPAYEDCAKFWSTVIPDVDIVLLSQGSSDALGAYALLFHNFMSHFISRIKVYATLPTVNFGRVTSIDLYASVGVLGPYTSNKLELEDIERAFDQIEVLKYSQLIDLRLKYDGLTLVAHNSGVSPGSSFWVISTYVEKLIYARSWNHTRSTILNAASIFDSTGKPISSLLRPSAVITSLERFGPSKPSRKREKLLIDTIDKTINAGRKGSVILPCDIGGNFLDLFVIVHDYLYQNRDRNGKYPNIPILLLSYSRGRSLTYARSMLEWLSSTVLKTWEARNNRSPFELDSSIVHVVSSPSEISKYSDPKICFVSMLEPLLSEVLERMCQNTSNTVILTSSPSSAVIGKESTNILAKMFEAWNSAAHDKNRGDSIEEGSKVAFSDSVDICVVKQERLLGEELEEFVQSIEKRRKETIKNEAVMRKEAKLAARSKDAFAINKEDGTNHTNGTTSNAEDLTLTGNSESEESGKEIDEEDEEEDDLVGILREESDDTTSRKRQAKVPIDTYITPTTSLRHRMFPSNPKRERRDDYGTLVDFSQFIPEDELSVPIVPHDNNDKRSQALKNKRGYLTNDEGASDKNGRGYEKRLKSSLDKEKELKELQRQFDNLDFLNSENDPSKRTVTKTKSKLVCQLTYINMENLVDQRSASIIWPSLKFKRLLLLGQRETQNEDVCQLFTKRGIEVLDPPFNESMELETTLKSLDILIDVSLDELLKWQRIGDGHTIAHVVGRLVKENRTVNSTSSLNRGKLVLKPLNNNARIQTGGTLSIGDVRLAELKRKLTELNHTAEFKGEGTLVVDRQVAVRKISDGETVINGPPSEVFDIVKKCITDMLAKI